MLFNTIGYVIFISIVFLLYWFIISDKKQRQNYILFFASIVFYSFWDWRFLSLLYGSVLFNFLAARKLDNSENKKSSRAWFTVAIVFNLLLIGIFKYFDFFSSGFSWMIRFIGFEADPILLKLLLPVGISFYTFHSLSYLADVYRQRIPIEKNFVTYAVFISFFPLLIAGPIERGTTLLPQLNKKRVFNKAQATEGLRLILWGIFKKVVIADQCAIYVDRIYRISLDSEMHFSGSTLALAVVLFAFQLYGDFSGYSDIASGSAKLLGIDLIRNFNYPYFSENIRDLWNRWHISLSSWFRDYVFIPLGGSRSAPLRVIFNVLIVFLLSGLWHGASLNFLLWGMINGLLFVPYLLLQKNKIRGAAYRNSLKGFVSMLITFSMFSLLLVLFRSSGLEQAMHIYSDLFSRSLFAYPAIDVRTLKTLFFLLLFILIEWHGRDFEIPIYPVMKKLPGYGRYIFYYALLACIWLYSGYERPFIYFQF